ncbi:DUF2806 domain-containing protein [Brevundimonas sp. NPDC092305]|uniref:DUF2806 domain-containing protein n=1 Tax=Brevundimonas sp. NPDC092305 TaxID=3363957 RepID=UPI003825E679
MTEEKRDLVPDASSSWVEKVLAEANLPQLLLGPAGKAISQLVAGAADIPVAYFERFTHRIRSRTAAEDHVSQSLATSVGQRIGDEAELAERAMSAWLPRAARLQQNREAVAQNAVASIPEYVRQEQDSSPHGELDPDWLNVFTRYAEDASSERMRELWGQVLAKEIVRFGSFSLRTIRFMSELDKKTADAFERMALRVFDHDAVDVPETLTDSEYADVFLSEQAGLISHGGLMKSFIIDDDGTAYVTIRQGELILFGTPNAKMHISCAHLTEVGREVMQILPGSPDRDTGVSVSKRISRLNLSRVEWDPCDGGSRDVLWTKPA